MWLALADFVISMTYEEAQSVLAAAIFYLGAMQGAWGDASFYPADCPHYLYLLWYSSRKVCHLSIPSDLFVRNLLTRPVVETLAINRSPSLCIIPINFY